MAGWTFSIILGLAFWPGIMSSATAPRWAVMAFGLPVLLFNKRVPLDGLGLAFLAVAASSILWGMVPVDAIGGFMILVLLALAYALGSSIDDLGPFYDGLTCAALISGALAVAQTFYPLQGFNLDEYGNAAGLFINKDVLGNLAAPLAIAAALRARWIEAALLFGVVILMSTRGALMGLAVALVVYLIDTGRSRIAVAAVLVFVTALAANLYRGGAGLFAAGERVAIWHDTIAGLTLFGRGIGSFFTAFPATADWVVIALRRPEFAYNEFLHFGFELGIAGLILPAILVVAFLGSGRNVGRYVLVCMAAQCAVSFLLHLPASGFLMALVAGHVRHRDHALCEP